MEDILLLGGGNHCGSVIDSIRSQGLYNPIGILDVPQKVGMTIQGIPIIGSDNQMINYFEEGIKNAFVTIGSIGSTTIREKLVELATEIGFIFPPIVDSTAIVSDYNQISQGVFIGKGTILNTNSTIGKHSIINTGAIIEHDCSIGDFVHVAPGTTLSGGVKIGDYSHIGTNATIIQEKIIGSHTLIGAGSVVIKDIRDNQIAYGNPCKEI